MVHLLAIVGMAMHLLVLPSVSSLLQLFLMIYAMPVFLFRIHNFFLKVPEGMSRLDLPVYSPWWASHQFQAVFNAFPFLEAFLRLIPGFYSFWLRLWGSQVGKGVYWTPRVEILDRNLVSVGDRAIFGHKVILCSHAIVKKDNGSTLLYVKKVCIGPDAFIGAGSQLGPGAVIAVKQVVPFGTVLTINKKIEC